MQPGGGLCYRIELAWGRWRRWCLKRLRGAYVRKMAELRRGDCDGAPHEVLDPRDLKYCRNRCACEWEAAHDPFAWRVLEHPDDPTQTAARLVALVRRANAADSDWPRAHFWYQMRSGRCYEQVVIDAAIEALARADGVARAGGEAAAREHDESRTRYIAALREYVASAKRQRSGEKNVATSAAEYPEACSA